MIYPESPDLVKTPPEDTPDTQKMDPKKPDLNSNSDPTKMKSHRRVVRGEYVGVKPYG